MQKYITINKRKYYQKDEEMIVEYKTEESRQQIDKKYKKIMEEQKNFGGYVLQVKEYEFNEKNGIVR